MTIFSRAFLGVITIMSLLRASLSDCLLGFLTRDLRAFAHFDMATAIELAIAPLYVDVGHVVACGHSLDFTVLHLDIAQCSTALKLAELRIIFL